MTHFSAMHVIKPGAELIAETENKINGSNLSCHAGLWGRLGSRRSSKSDPESDRAMKNIQVQDRALSNIAYSKN
ncbi:MAG: hypothetical protein WBQ08_10885 [Candidatus Sulfotelmatobacter sp.]